MQKLAKAGHTAPPLGNRLRVQAFPQCRPPACRIVQPIVEMSLLTSVNLLGIQSNPLGLWGGVGWGADSGGCAGDNTNLSELGGRGYQPETESEEASQVTGGRSLEGF